MTNAQLFIQTRARLQRLSDMKFFTGWVESISPEQVRIRLKSPKASVSRGDNFSVEVAGKEKTAAFVGMVSDVAGSVVVLALPQGMTLLPKKESARFFIFGTLGRILLDGEEHAITLVDISENGLGVLADSNLERGTIVEFEIFTPLGSVCGCGEIRYSRIDPDSPSRFRAGIQLKERDRIESARWNQLLNATMGK
jgi:hypothetical protein